MASHNVLVAVPLPPLALLAIIPIAALLILHHKKINTAGTSIACYSLLLALIFAYVASTHSALSIDTIECNKGSVHLIQHHKQLIIIDPGVIGRRLSASSWCEHTLMPTLAKKYGATTIDHLIILQPNRIIFDALANLQEKICIKNIYIPFWQGDMPSYWLRSFMQLKRACAEHQCNLIRLGTKPLKIMNCLDITALEQIIRSHEFSYNSYQVSGIIDNQSICLYSAKHSTVDKKGEINVSQSSHDNRPRRLSTT